MAKKLRKNKRNSNLILILLGVIVLLVIGGRTGIIELPDNLQLPDVIERIITPVATPGITGDTDVIKLTSFSCVNNVCNPAPTTPTLTTISPNVGVTHFSMSVKATSLGSRDIRQYVLDTSTNINNVPTADGSGATLFYDIFKNTGVSPTSPSEAGLQLSNIGPDGTGGDDYTWYSQCDEANCDITGTLTANECPTPGSSTGCDAPEVCQTDGGTGFNFCLLPTSVFEQGTEASHTFTADVTATWKQLQGGVSTFQESNNVFVTFTPDISGADVSTVTFAPNGIATVV